MTQQRELQALIDSAPVGDPVARDYLLFSGGDA
jgi:hypothetical protein